MKKFSQIYKEIVMEDLITEGVYDPGIFKAFFLAGGPGSGKSFVTASAFAATGLKVVNSDAAFERGLTQANLSLKMPNEEEYFRNLIRNRAKMTASTALDTYIEGRLGVVIDATGRDLGKVSSDYNKLKALGYDCYMIFVNTSLDIALERQKGRDRQVPEYVVRSNWKKVQQNMGSFQHIFGRSNFLLIDNNKSEEELVSLTLKKAANFVRSNLRTKPNNHIAKQWIVKELEARKRI
jgi:predicted kinase